MNVVLPSILPMPNVLESLSGVGGVCSHVEARAGVSVCVQCINRCVFMSQSLAARRKEHSVVCVFEIGKVYEVAKTQAIIFLSYSMPETSVKAMEEA